MNRREFQFVEGTSNKFWAIELNGKSHTVHFGRVGTTGQTQTREFASEDEAKKSYDKLIAEKVKKGYTETSSGTKSTGTPAAKVKKVDEEPATKTPKRKAAPEPQAPAAVPANLSITRTIELNSADWRWAGKRDKSPTQSTTPAPFDLNACLDRLRKVSVSKWGWDWDWKSAGIPVSMSREEAQFWFTAMTALEHKFIAGLASSNRSRELPKMLADKMAGFKPKANFSLKDVRAGLVRTPQVVSKLIVFPLVNLFTAFELTDLIQNKLEVSKDVSYGSDCDQRIRAILVEGFCEHVVPALSDEEVKKLQAHIRPELNLSKAPADFYGAFPPEFHIAVALGMRKELAAVVQTQGKRI